MTASLEPGRDPRRLRLRNGIKWKPWPTLPDGAQLSVLLGEPDEAAPFAIRMRVRPGTRIMPHRHPADYLCIVMSGDFYTGVGEEFDAGKLVAYPPGTSTVLMKGPPYFHRADSDACIIQITAMGPFHLDYVNPEDDPRPRARPVSGVATRRPPRAEPDSPRYEL
jgi:quercetin dioxygenase-like cupin family protein